jgi:menaquinol-cytochrome c reductase iron-sulfur subunit
VNDDTTPKQSSPDQPPTPEEITRRHFLERICLGLGGLCAAVLGIPLVGFIVSPLFRKTPRNWVSVGEIGDFEVGKTVNVTIIDPSPLPWAGVTAKTAVWLRRVNDQQFIAFSVNCTHMGCPVRWLPSAELFMCPCHGGVYYADGTVAAGPPPKPLIRYDVRTTNGQVEIRTMAIPITTRI